MAMFETFIVIQLTFDTKPKFILSCWPSMNRNHDKIVNLQRLYS